MRRLVPAEEEKSVGLIWQMKQHGKENAALVILFGDIPAFT